MGLISSWDDTVVTLEYNRKIVFSTEVETRVISTLHFLSIIVSLPQLNIQNLRSKSIQYFALCISFLTIDLMKNTDVGTISKLALDSTEHGI